MPRNPNPLPVTHYRRKRRSILPLAFTLLGLAALGGVFLAVTR